MITVKFLGGAKKSFLVDSLVIDKNDITIQQLLDFLIKNKPKNSINLDHLDVEGDLRSRAVEQGLIAG